MIWLIMGRTLTSVESGKPVFDAVATHLVYPATKFRRLIPEDVPADLRDDYAEACAVLDISPKASAALSRRCLQTMLRKQGYLQHNLFDQVSALLSENDATKVLPTYLHNTVDAIRNFGNFSAHPIDDKTALQVIAVEPQEAEWCLEILEELFDHYYERPKLQAAKKAALDAKLAAAGKPKSL
jgi:hypothetical protein